MSELPEGWVQATLGELGDWSSGGTPSRSKPEYFDGDIPFVKTGDLDDTWLSSVPENISDSGLQNSSAKLFPEGTLLIAMYGATIGKTARLSIEAATNQACAALLGNDANKDALDYVWAYLRSQLENLRAAGKGGAQPNISQTLLKSYPIPVAPLPEQQRIVRKLDSLTARTSTARTHLNAIKKLVERYRQSIIDATFAPFELTVPLIDLVDSDTGIPYGIVQTGDHQEDGVPTVRAGDIKGFRLLEEGLKRVRSDVAEQYGRTKLKGGEVLIAIRGSVGETCVVPGTMAGNNISREVALIPVSEDTNASFIMYFLRSAQAAQYIKANIKGVAQTGINLRDLKRLQCPDLDKHYQAETVRLIESAFAKIDRLASEAEKALKLTDRLDERILAKAFAGELVPQDPNDDPASVLLDRIREARANAPKKPRPRRTKATAMKKDPKDLLLADSAKWPANGVTSEELTNRVAMPHSDLRDALFELIGGTTPQLEQVFDKTEERMRLKRVAQ